MNAKATHIQRISYYKMAAAHAEKRRVWIAARQLTNLMLAPNCETRDELRELLDELHPETPVRVRVNRRSGEIMVSLRGINSILAYISSLEEALADTEKSNPSGQADPDNQETLYHD